MGDDGRWLEIGDGQMTLDVFFVYIAIFFQRHRLRKKDVNRGGWMLFGNQGRENHRLDVSLKACFVMGYFTISTGSLGTGDNFKRHTLSPINHGRGKLMKITSILAQKFHVGDTPMASTLNHDFFLEEWGSGIVAFVGLGKA